MRAHAPSRPASQRTLGYAIALCVVVYVFCAKGYLEVSDTTYSVETAQALVSRGQLDIPFESGRTLAARDGRGYSKYGMGLALYYMPWVAAGDVLARAAHRPPGEIIGFLLSFANIPFVVLALVLFAGLLRRLGIGANEAVLWMLALGLGTLAWRYAGYDFSEGMQMGLLMAAVYGTIRGTRAAIIAAGAAFAALFLVKLVWIAVIPIFAVYLLARPRTGSLRWRDRLLRAFWFYAPAGLSMLVLLWLNHARFGNALESGYGSEAGRFSSTLLFTSIPGLLFSPDKGLLLFCPVLLLGLLGWRAFARRYRAEAALAAALIAANLVLTGAWWSWGGGWAWGPRLLVPTLPLWLVPAPFWLESLKPRTARIVFAAVVLVSIVAQVPGVLVKDQEIHDIKETMLSPAERASAPSDTVMAWLLLRHKLGGGSEVYSAAELHVAGSRSFDLGSHPTLRGWNVWTEQAARQLQHPAIRWLALLALLAIAGLAWRLREALQV